MINFFRSIRRRLFTEGKATRYLLYAIGEIVLVVIGILIALQINTWNENRKLREREQVLLLELKSNLQTNIENLESDISKQLVGTACMERILHHLDQQKPQYDSLPYDLAQANYAPDVILTASAFETLKSTGLELIRSDSLRRTIINLFEVTYPTLMQETKRLEDQLWPAVVTPLYQKHFRSENFVWVPVDYNALLNDTEFTNMLSFRRSLRIQSTTIKSDAVAHTANVIALIDTQLAKW